MCFFLSHLIGLPRIADFTNPSARSMKWHHLDINVLHTWLPPCRCVGFVQECVAAQLETCQANVWDRATQERPGSLCPGRPTLGEAGRPQRRPGGLGVAGRPGGWPGSHGSWPTTPKLSQFHPFSHIFVTCNLISQHNLWNLVSSLSYAHYSYFHAHFMDS